LNLSVFIKNKKNAFYDLLGGRPLHMCQQMTLILHNVNNNRMH